MGDERLKRTVLIPSDNPLITENEQIEIIYQAIDRVFDGGGAIVRRIPFSEDYRNFTPEE